jgi:ArsR family metal-binding transcriptional regulator
MSKTSLSLLFLVFAFPLSAQIVAIREVKEPIPGVCDNAKVYAALIFDGQVGQKCAMPKAEVEALLNSNVTYLQKNPKFKLKKYESVSTIVNCSGELVAVELDTKSPEFNEQVIKVFRELKTTWTSGTINGKPVDSADLWGIAIKKGRIVLD